MFTTINLKKILFILVAFIGITNSTKAQYLSVRYELEGFAGTTYAGMYNWGMWNYGSNSVYAIEDLCDVHLFNNKPGNAKIDMVYTGLTNYHGVVIVEFPADYIGQEVYIGIKSRNHIYTVSSTCVKLPDCHATGHYDASIAMLNGYYDYDFTTSQSQAFGDNMVLASNGLWSFYAGDVNQDCSVDAFDGIIVNDLASQFGSGCSIANADVDGDGAISNLDIVFVDQNSTLGITCQIPTKECSDKDDHHKLANAPKTTIDVSQKNSFLQVEYKNIVKGNTEVNIYDILGRKMQSQNINTELENGTVSLQNNNLATGTYILELNNNNKRIAKTFAIK